MKHVRVLVTNRFNDEFPRLVEFTLQDASGETHRFVEKEPVISSTEITRLPLEAVIACNVLGSATDPDGSILVEIDTSPWGIESDSGRSRFLVHESQLIVQGSAA